jgi:isoquinoline 1-oxidoreductase beta subunit
MLTVVVAHPPRFGAKVARFDAAKAMAVKGVVAVKQIPTGVAVYATGTWPAIKGRKALAIIVWDEARQKARQRRNGGEYLAKARRRARPPRQWRCRGGAGHAGAKVSRRSMSSPIWPMRRWSRSAAISNGTARPHRALRLQFPSFDQPAMAKVLGLPIPSRCGSNRCWRAAASAAARQATRISRPNSPKCAKAIGPGRPLRLTWTREDDIHGGYYRPLIVHRMKGAVKDGKIIAWSDSIVGQSFAIGGPMEKMMVQNGVDSTMVEGSDKPPYESPPSAAMRRSISRPSPRSGGARSGIPTPAMPSKPSSIGCCRRPARILSPAGSS